MESPQPPVPALTLADWVSAYLAQMTPKQRLGHEIATEQLGGSYSVEKSVRFLRYVREKQAQAQAQA